MRSICLFIVGAAWSCSLAAAATQPRYGGELRRGVVGRIEVPNVPRVRTALDVELSRQVHAGLYRFDEEGEPAPDLVERAEILSGGNRVRLTLVEAQFHDGQPVTSADVKESIRQGSGPASLLGRVGQGVDPVVIVDPRTLILDVSGAPGLWPWVLAGVELSILPVGGDGRIGAGPFTLANAAEGTLRLLAYARHHRGRPLLDAIVYASYKDERALLFAHRHRGLHVAMTIGENSADPSFGVVPEIVTLRADVAIKGLREAVAGAVEREALVDVVLGGNGRVALGVLDPRPARGLKREIDAETRPTAAARILYAEESGLRRIAERVRVDLQGAGLRVTLEAVEPARLQARPGAGELALVPFTIGGVPMALQLAAACRRFDLELPGSLLQAAQRGTQDGSDSAVLVLAEDEIVQRAGLVVLFQRDRRIFVQDSVQDARLAVDGALMLENAWLWPQP